MSDSFHPLPISEAWRSQRRPGLARYVLDDTTKLPRYFRNVALDEAPELVTAESCAQSLPSCDASYVPWWKWKDREPVRN